MTDPNFFSSYYTHTFQRPLLEMLFRFLLPSDKGMAEVHGDVFLSISLSCKQGSRVPLSSLLLKSLIFWHPNSASLVTFDCSLMGRIAPIFSFSSSIFCSLCVVISLGLEDFLPKRFLGEGVEVIIFCNCSADIPTSLATLRDTLPCRAGWNVSRYK